LREYAEEMRAFTSSNGVKAGTKIV
jgi:hypothetical protein